MKKTTFLFLFIFLINGVNAEINSSEYYYVIQENGNTIVGINLYGSGEITLILPEDVTNPYVGGGLYIQDNEKMTIAIGTTESAVVVYETAKLTIKTEDEWIFKSNLDNQTSKTIMAALPSNVMIKESNPLAFIEKEDFTKLYWNDHESINFSYYFPGIILPDLPPETNGSLNDEIFSSSDDPESRDEDSNFDSRNKENLLKEEIINISQTILQNQDIDSRIPFVIPSHKKNQGLNYFYFLYIVPIIFALVFVLLLYKHKISKKMTPRQIQIIKTLSENESKVVEYLLNQKSIAKRSNIEKSLGLAKSSLAATINNLEKKKILEVDRTYNSHLIKLSDWFIKF